MIKPYPRNPDYLVSDEGFIYSLKSGKMRPMKRLILKGYYACHTFDNGKDTYRQIHTMVLETFSGPKPEGMECRHLDGDPLNNHIDNLEWGTHKENGEDTARHGRSTAGERNHHAVLTEAQAIEVKRLTERDDITKAEIARRYGVSHGAVSNIAFGRTWKHLEIGEDDE